MELRKSSLSIAALALFLTAGIFISPGAAKSPDVIFRGRIFTDTDQPLPTGYQVKITVNDLTVSAKVERGTGLYLIDVPREEFLAAFKEGLEVEINACDTEGNQLSKIEQVLEPIYLLQAADKKRVFIDLPEKKVIIPDQPSVKAFLFQGTLRTAEGYPALEGYTVSFSNTRTKQAITEKVDKRTGEYTTTFIDITSTGLFTTRSSAKTPDDLTPLSVDEHHGFTGAGDRHNRYRVRLEKLDPSLRYFVVGMVYNQRDFSTSGSVWLRRSWDE